MQPVSTPVGSNHCGVPPLGRVSLDGPPPDWYSIRPISAILCHQAFPCFSQLTTPFQHPHLQILLPSNPFPLSAARIDTHTSGICADDYKPLTAIATLSPKPATYLSGEASGESIRVSKDSDGHTTAASVGPHTLNARICGGAHISQSRSGRSGRSARSCRSRYRVVVGASS